MRVALILIAVTALGWMFLLTVLPAVVVHAQLDAVVPPDVLTKLTPEERKEILDGLRALNPPPSDRWLLPPALILALSLFGLWRGRRAAP